MLCCSSPHRKPRDQDESKPLLAGTWDFKWRRGTNIRVAFQGSSDIDTLDQARARVVDAFYKWNVTDVKGGFLSFSLVDEPLPPAFSAGVARSAQSPGGGRERAYDVLISVDPLPLWLPHSRQREGTQVIFPRSELGTYARRVRWGVPTAFLGCPDNRRDWFASPEGRFTVLHEVGHMLGIPHLHQNPYLLAPADGWKQEEEIWQTIQQRQRLDEAAIEALRKQEFVTAEITARWPTKVFSDWITTAMRVDELDSVMVKPIIKCLFAGHDCRADCDYERRDFERLQEPTALDNRHLELMYPQPAAATAPAAA